MKKDSETTLQKTVIASRRILIFSFLCFGLVAALSFAIRFLQWSWLEPTAKVLLTFTFLGFGISGIAPAAFLIVGAPQLALAWYRASNPAAWPETSWKEVSVGKKIFLVLWSAFLAIAIITIAINFDY